MKDVDLEEPTSFFDHVYLGCTQRECSISNQIVAKYRDMFEARISAGAKETLPTRASRHLMQKSYLLGPTTWKVMQRNLWKDIANLRIKRLNSSSTKSQHHDDHHVKEEENGSLGELSTVCSQIVLKCLYLVRIGRPDILWSVFKLARAVTKWTEACDKRLARLTSHIHHTREYRQYCYARL